MISIEVVKRVGGISETFGYDIDKEKFFYHSVIGGKTRSKYVEDEDVSEGVLQAILFVMKEVAGE